MGIESYLPGTGRRLKEDGSVINTAEYIGEHIKTATIAAGVNESDVVDMRNAKFGALIIPEIWTAANITITACDTAGGIFTPVYTDDGTELSITVGGASRTIALSDTALGIASLAYIKLRSGTVAIPVNQAAERVIKLMMKN